MSYCDDFWTSKQEVFRVYSWNEWIRETIKVYPDEFDSFKKKKNLVQLSISNVFWFRLFFPNMVFHGVCVLPLKKIISYNDKQYILNEGEQKKTN